MEETTPFFSPEDLAAKLDLHVRTIRRYIREGRLKATRIGKQYRIAASDFQAFVGTDLPIQAEPQAARARRAVVSATTDIHGISPSESERISTMLSGAFTAMRSRAGTYLESVYYEEVATLRIVVHADLEFANAVLSMVNSVLSDDSAYSASEEER